MHAESMSLICRLDASETQQQDVTGDDSNSLLIIGRNRATESKLGVPKAACFVAKTIFSTIFIVATCTSHQYEAEVDKSLSECA